MKTYAGIGMRQISKSLILLVIICMSIKLSAQEKATSPIENKHGLYMNIGGMLGPVVSVNYEYIFNRAVSGKKSLWYLRGSIGKWTSWDGVVFAAQAGLFTRAQKNHHLDFGLGPYVLTGESIIPVTATVTYRYQKPDGIFMLRLGGGLVEGGFCSVGFRF
jgi:hypothetical protein